MPAYEVTLHQTVSYVVEVDAASTDEAVALVQSRLLAETADDVAPHNEVIGEFFSATALGESDEGLHRDDMPPERALLECYELWAGGAWPDSNALPNLEEVMDHVGRLLRAIGQLPPVTAR